MHPFCSRFAPVLALITGCVDAETTPVVPCSQQTTDIHVFVDGVQKVDLLVLIDNSASMAEEQRALRAELPKIVRALASGDPELGVEGDPGAGVQDFSPVRDLHVGVVTSDMGSLGNHVGGACDEPVFGDDGVLRTGGNPGDEPELDCPEDLAGPNGERFLTFRNPRGVRCSTDPNACVGFVDDFACVSALGTDGCGFEMPLEAVLKSLQPSDTSCSEAFCRFHQGTKGKGDRANEGFLREDSLLAILVVTDEEDCSSPDGDLFERSAGDVVSDPKLRCVENPAALYPVRRYVDGLLSLRRYPRDLIFSVIAGVNTQLVRRATDAESGEQDFEQMLDDPSMVPLVTADGDGLAPSCRSENGLAYPPRRLVQVARELQRRGARAVVQSICQTSFQPAISRILAAVSHRAGQECLPGPLSPDSNGRVRCSVTERPPSVGPRCRCSELPGRTRVSLEIDPVTERLREVCSVAQVPVPNQQVPEGSGWGSARSPCHRCSGRWIRRSCGRRSPCRAGRPG